MKLQSDTAVSYSSTDGAGLTTFVKSTPVKDTSLKGQVAVFADESPIVAGNIRWMSAEQTVFRFIMSRM